jgi:peptidyl-prolyl cis-trans isomerase SurA
MRIKALCLAVFMSCFYLGWAQEERKVLFTIDGEEVYTSEFLRVYEKNKEIVVEEAGKGFDDYFDLFLDFKLKLKQARDQDLDTSSTYLSDLAKYREQLLQPYLQNPEALDELTQEAYQRTIVEVNASHILIRVAPEALPVDSLIAFDRISEARTEILSGKEFEAVAKVYSEDPSVQQNGGNLGYFSAFDMVYPFENAAYETEIGGISKPFRTQFGFHLVKVVDKRKSPGEIEVSHIMVKTDSLNPDKSREKIEEIYQSLEQGDDFARIAQEHSDDLSSSKKGGKLPKFGTGRMIKSFEDVAFSLENEGEYSKPFSTQFGWHILKLDKKYPIPPYEELKPRLEAKVKNSSRAGYVERSLAQKVGSDYSLVINMKLLNSLKELNDFEGRTDTILKIQERVFVGDDFYHYAESEKNKTVGELFDEFKNREIIEYYKDHLEDSNSEFAATYNEYRDGLLLFELLQKQIWDRSENDSVELENYFKQHRERYNWQPRAEVLIGSCTQKQKAEEVRRLLLKGRSAESIKEEINEGAIIHVLFSQGKLEEGSSKLPEGYTFEPGVSQIFEEGENQFTLIRVDRIYPETRKELKEARGEVLNDYQNYLEESWVRELRETYAVKINKRNYKELKTKLEN